MNETFKNIAIFLTFLAGLLLWNQARVYMKPPFDFQYGTTALLFVWSSGVVILFHALYHYFGKTSEKTTYLTTLGTLLLVGGLVYFQKIPLP